MPRGSSEGVTSTRGGTAWNDGVYSFDGGSPGIVPSIFTETPNFTFESGGNAGRGADVISSPSWFAPIEDSSECKDGVCPVPWLTQDKRPDLQPDVVNHPPHYIDGSVECIDAIEAQLTTEEYRGALKMAIVKYVWRERHKGGTESLKKARWYLDRLIAFDEAQNG